MMIMNPIAREFVPMRLIPVKKRMIRSYKTKDGKDVEVRTCSMLGCVGTLGGPQLPRYRRYLGSS